MNPLPTRRGRPGWLARLGGPYSTPYRVLLVVSLLTIALLFVGASLAQAHHADGHDGGNGNGASNGGGNGNGANNGGGNGNGAKSGGGPVESRGNNDVTRVVDLSQTRSSQGNNAPLETIDPEPVAPEPVTYEPVTYEPVTYEPVTYEPVTPEVVTPEPVTPEVVTPEVVTTEPVIAEVKPLTPELDPLGSVMGEDETDSDPPEPDPGPIGSGGGGGPPLEMDVENRFATAPLQLPEIGFTYWVDEKWIYVLADPLDEDNGQTTYKWIWGDGQVTLGGAYESHRLIDGVEQTIITLVRLDAEGEATHEGIVWIDLTFYRYTGPAHHAPGASAQGPTSSVVFLEADDHQAGPKTQSDIGALVEAAPAPHLLPLLGLLLLVRLRRKE